MFINALKADMKDYIKKQGKKPTVDEVVAEFDKNPFIMSLANKHLNMDSSRIRGIVEEVLDDGKESEVSGN
jgi:hypothetical protein